MPPESRERRHFVEILLIVFASLAVVFSWPSWIRAPLGFLLLGWLPGWIVVAHCARKGKLSIEERAGLALAFTLPLVIGTRLLAARLGLPSDAFVLGWTVLLLLGAVSAPPHGRFRGRGERFPILLALAFGILVTIPPLVSPAFRVWGDAMHHTQMVYELQLRGLPPQDSAYAGFPLTYMWLFHVWIAALSEAMGTTPYAVYPWVNAASLAVLILVVYRVAAHHWPNRLARRLAPSIAALGMNAQGWMTGLGVLALSGMIGAERGPAKAHSLLANTLVHPSAADVAAAMIYRSSFLFSSFLFRYFYASALGLGLTLVGVAYLLALSSLRRWNYVRGAALAVVSGTAIALHPLVCAPAIAGLGLGLLVTRGPAARAGSVRGPLAAILLGCAGAAPILLSMMGRGLSSGDRTGFTLSLGILPTLAQVLFVVAIPAVWGWRETLTRRPAAAWLGLGFVGSLIIMSLTLDFPYVGEQYIVYPLYLGVALFAGGGIARFLGAGPRCGPRSLRWIILGLVFLPSAMFQLQGFARHDGHKGWAGWPETADERAVFDFVRASTPVDAIVFDSQVFYSPAAAAYSGRRALFGGMRWARILGLPAGEMGRREKALNDLFFATDVSGSTWSLVDSLTAPVYVVARRERPAQCELPPLPDPVRDSAEKLLKFPDRLRPVLTTPSVILFKYRKGDGRVSPP